MDFTREKYRMLLTQLKNCSYEFITYETAHEVAGLQNEKTMPIEQWMKQLNLPEKELAERQEQQRKQIGDKFIDIKQYIIDTIGL